MSKVRGRMNRRDFLYTAGLAGAAMAAVPILSACAGEAPEAAPATPAAPAMGPKRLMVYNSPFIAGWDRAINTGAIDFCKMAGWEFIETGVSEYSIEIRLRTISESIALKPDLLITNLNDPALGPPLLEAMEKGMKVIIEDGGDVEYMEKVGLPYRVGYGLKTGKKYGKYLCDLIVSRLGKREGTIILGDCNPGISPVVDRVRGVEAAIPEYNKENGTNFTLVVFPDATYEGVEASYARWESTYETNKDTLVATANTGGPPAGNYAWAKDMGFTRENRNFIAATYNPDTSDLENTEAGYFDFLTYTNYYGFGCMCGAEGWQWLERGFPPENVLVGGEIVPAEDVPRIRAREKIWQDKGREYGLTIA